MTKVQTKVLPVVRTLPVDKKTTRDTHYPVEKIDFVYKILTVNIRSHLLYMITLKEQMTQMQITVLFVVWTSTDI